MPKLLPIRELKKREADVPCNGCSACCVSDLVFLDPAVDDMNAYDWHFEVGLPVRDRKENGECVYLNKGCSIHQTRPKACRLFDCRVWYLDTSKAKRKQMIRNNASLQNVFQAGKRLLSTLDRSGG